VSDRAGSPADRGPALRLRGARVAYDSRVALEGADLDVAPGEVVAVVGPSGSGKTTLLRVLGASRAPDAGTAEVLGERVDALGASALRTLRARIGFVHQDHALVPNVRVAQNVLAGALGRRGLLGGLRDLVWPRRADLERAHAVLDRVGIEETLFQRTDTLSGGQQQRVAIARALFQSPEALLADEPVASVDPSRAEALVQLLVELAREHGWTLVASLHDLELARRWFPRLVGLRSGRVVIDAPTADVDAAALEALFAIEGIGEVEA
jgi:phosphonate transport system ATP-binding protein